MGLLNFFKNMFRPKQLCLPKPKNMDFIQPLSNGFDTIVLGQPLVVEKDWVAVIVAKGQTLDMFSEGQHTLGLAYLPKATKALGLDRGKVKKHGVTAEVVLPEKFRCDLYFVFLGENPERKWKSDEIKIKSKQTKHLHYFLEGTFLFQVQDAEKAIKLFLIDWPKIKTGKVGQKLDSLLSDLVSEILWSKKYKDKTPFLEFDFANVVLKPLVNKTFLNYGIVVLDMQLSNLVFPENFSATHYESVSPDKEDASLMQRPKLENSLPPEEKLLTQTAQPETKLIDKDLQEIEQKNLEISEKPVKKPRFFKKEVKSASCEPVSEKQQISFVVKNDLKEIENEGEKRKKVPFYSFKNSQKNTAYKTADKLANVCSFCGTVNLPGSDTCKNCNKKL